MGRERGKNQGWRRKNDGVNWNKDDEGEGDGSGDGDGTKGGGGEGNDVLAPEGTRRVSRGGRRRKETTYFRQTH